MIYLYSLGKIFYCQNVEAYRKRNLSELYMDKGLKSLILCMLKLYKAVEQLISNLILRQRLWI